MSPLKSDDPDELLQRAAAEVVDGGKELGDVARKFGVNEEYLGQAVWFMKENRQREAQRRWGETHEPALSYWDPSWQ